MLTPSSEDPNRERELKRREREPDTFRHNPTIEINEYSGLTDSRGKPLITDPRANSSQKEET